MSEKGAFDPRQEAPLLSAYVDGELGPADVARVEAYLAENTAARREVAALRSLKNVTGAMRLVEPPPEVWETFWAGVYNRAERSVGWIVLTIGAGLTGAWAVLRLVTLLADARNLPLYVKCGIFGIAAGLLVLLISVIRERLYRRRRTRYKDVIR